MHVDTLSLPASQPSSALWQGRRPLLFMLFFVSGFAGLIYQSIWSHYLKLFLGHSAYAQTLVLAIFMGGMAIGAWICSRTSSRWRNLLLLYAAVEALIGVSALVFHPLFVLIIENAFTQVIPTLESPLQIQLYKWGLAGLLILPQSILLGMSFPLMSGGLIRLFPDNSGGSIALLYFTNSLGGAIGVLVSGFVSIRLLGLDGTVTLAGAINIILAAIVWQLFRHYQTPSAPATASPGQTGRKASIKLMLAVALLTGAASFIYEITWIRMLSMVLGSSTHAFELMLSAFIFGLALGGLWIHRRIDRLTEPVLFLAKVQIVMGLAALSTLPLYGQTFHLMQWFMSLLPEGESGYLAFNLISHAIAMLVMFPTAFCAGMTLPLITHSLMKQRVGERAIGAVYASNTLGAIAGIIAAVHIGLPLLGTKGTLLAGALIDLLLGVILLITIRRYFFSRQSLVWSAAALTSFALVSLTVDLSPHKMASGVFRTGNLLDDEQQVLDFRDGKTATISLTTNPYGTYSIRTNGKPDASISMRPGMRPRSDEVTMTLTAAIPLLVYPEAKRIANIGFGSGLTSNVLLASPNLTRLDNVEIEPAMVEVAKAFHPYNARVFNDPRSHIHIDDAKTYFSSGKKRYDLIVSEPSNPWVSGVSGLFSIEFYNNIKRHLNQGGMLAQWLQVYEFNMPLLASTLKALAAEFQHFTVYAVDQGNLLILASNSPIPELEGHMLSIPELAADLNRIGVSSHQDIRVRWVGDRTFLSPLIAKYPVPANSDYFPYVDQNAAKARYLKSAATDIFFPTFETLPIRAVLAGREISQADTQINSSPLAKLSIRPALAQYIFAQLQERTTDARQYQWELTPLLDSTDSLIQGCRVLPRHGDKVFLMYGIATATLPYLNPRELSGIWSTIETLPCGQNLTNYESDWLSLFKAISQRNMEDSHRLAMRLLQQPHRLTEARSKYLLGISLLSLLALDQHEQAQELWHRYPSVHASLTDQSHDLQYLRLIIDEATRRES